MLRWIFALLLASFLPAQELRLQVLATTDTHGHILPVDTYSLKPVPEGWARLATLVRERRAANPNTVLIDCGDTFQGEPVNYVRARFHPDLPEPAVAVLNELGCAAMALGNHDFDWGLDTLRGIERQAGFPLLSANAVSLKDGRPAFRPYVIVEQGGLRIAVLGLTTPRVPALVPAGHVAGLRFLDPVEAARSWVPRLRKEERADLVLVSLHAGLGQLPGRPDDDNCALRLADQVEGIDLILAGHTHQAVLTTHRSVPVLQADHHGRALGQAEFRIQRKDGRWQVLGVQTSLLRPTLETVADPRVLQLTETVRKRTDLYLDTFATTLLTDLNCRYARIEDTPVMQLLHQVQREATGAQLSAASLPNPRIFIPKGPTSVRQFWALMPYENALARIRITGAQLRAYLEHAAAAFHFSHEAELYRKDVPHYNVDTVDGCTYALDLSRPPGDRVTRLRVQGQPVGADQSFTLAISSYRLSGGGGYLEAIGFQGTPELVTTATLRNLLLQRVLSRPELAIQAVDGWRTVPYLDRERVE